jgi:phosphate transport system protein
MLRQAFEQKLQMLQTELQLLGCMVDGALEGAVEALIQQDLSSARRIIVDNRTLTSKRAAIEAETLSQIATQQPVASDLRTLVAVLEVVAELERMGSYAASIAQSTLNLAEQPLSEPFVHIIPQMGEKGRAMLRQSLLALAERDLTLARSIPAWDDEVDQLYHEVCQALVVVIKTDPSNTHHAACLSRVAHNLERTADRVINICEWVVFAVTGEMKELNRA